MTFKKEFPEEVIERLESMMIGDFNNSRANNVGDKNFGKVFSFLETTAHHLKAEESWVRRISYWKSQKSIDG